MSRLYNLREYHRPTDIDEAVRLLQRRNIHTIALAGGVTAVGEGSAQIEAVVDLDGLGLDFIEQEDGALILGAMLRLQTVVEKLRNDCDALLSEAAHRTAGWHVRNMATVGGVLAAGDSHSPLSVALAALKARVRIHGQAGEPPLWADLASQIRMGRFRSKLITAVSLTLPRAHVGAWYEQVARTPSDRPIVSAAAVARSLPKGAVGATVAVGGLLDDLLVIDHKGKLTEHNAFAEDVAARITGHRAAEGAYLSDYLGSAEYRRGVALLIARRALVTALARLSASLAA